MSSNNLKRVLYLSYDGLNDPLGQSQILPYISSIAKKGFVFEVISAEKALNNHIESPASKENGIVKRPIRYHKKPPILSTLWDLWSMYKLADRIFSSSHFHMIHCRSYLPALVGIKLKKKYNTPVLFDMRGFWIEERVEGGLWNLQNPLFKLIFYYLKNIEKKLIRDSDHIIVLTYKAKEILKKTFKISDSKVTVIPCCVDLDQFISDNSGSKSHDICYLGSLGTWYMLDEMLDFFKVYLNSYPTSKFRIYTKDSSTQVEVKCRAKQISAESVIVKPISRQEIPKVLPQCAFSIFFIKPGYSKLGSSATKLGELLAMGIPVVTNPQVGDQKDIFRQFKAGVLVPEFSEKAYQEAINKLATTFFDSNELRSTAEACFSLRDGVDRYISVYHSLI